MSDTILDAVGQSDTSKDTSTDTTQAVQTDDKIYEWATGQVKKEFLIDDLKGKATITDFVKHYQRVKSELETVKSGVKDYVKIPGEKATPEEIAAYRKAQGIPESPDKYDLKVEKLPEGIALEENTVAGFKQLAHEYGLTPKQAQALLEFDVKRQEAGLKSSQESRKQKAEEGVKLLKEKHGEKFNENLVHALRVITRLGGEEAAKEFNENYGLSPNAVNTLMKMAEAYTEDGITKGASASHGGDIFDLYPSMKEEFKK